MSISNLFSTPTPWLTSFYHYKISLSNLHCLHNWDLILHEVFNSNTSANKSPGALIHWTLGSHSANFCVRSKIRLERIIPSRGNSGDLNMHAAGIVEWDSTDSVQSALTQLTVSRTLVWGLLAHWSSLLQGWSSLLTDRESNPKLGAQHNAQN